MSKSNDTSRTFMSNSRFGDMQFLSYTSTSKRRMPTNKALD